MKWRRHQRLHGVLEASGADFELMIAGRPSQRRWGWWVCCLGERIGSGEASSLRHAARAAEAVAANQRLRRAEPRGWSAREGRRGAASVRVLVCGGRNFADPVKLEAYLAGIPGIAAIIEGGAAGADTLARQFGEQYRIPVETFPADWSQHGYAAGPIRNRQMLDEGRPHLVVAFPGGRGTANMVRLARAAGVPVVEVE